MERQPFDDFRGLVGAMPPASDSFREHVLATLRAFEGPKPVLGYWTDTLAWLASWQQTEVPHVDRPLIAVFSGTHDVAKTISDHDIISAAKARVENLTSGTSVLPEMSSSLNAAFKVYEMGLEFPVPDMTEDETLSENECAAAMAFGMEVVAEGADIIVLGNVGYGSSIAAAAIAKGLFGGSSAYWAGGDNRSTDARVQAVEDATTRHADRLSDPLACLQCFGGRDIAGLVGAIIAARHQSIPIILDGFVVTVAAAVLHAIEPRAIEHCISGHISSEPAHGALLDRIGLAPTFDLGVAVGDGTGATFALSGLRLAAKGLKGLSA